MRAFSGTQVSGFSSFFYDLASRKSLESYGIAT